MHSHSTETPLHSQRMVQGLKLASKRVGTCGKSCGKGRWARLQLVSALIGLLSSTQFKISLFSWNQHEGRDSPVPRLCTLAGLGRPKLGMEFSRQLFAAQRRCRQLSTPDERPKVPSRREDKSNPGLRESLPGVREEQRVSWRGF